jgi:hypothetical protein
MSGARELGRTGCRDAGMSGAWELGRLGAWNAGMSGVWELGRTGGWYVGSQGAWEDGRLGAWNVGSLGGAAATAAAAAARPGWKVACRRRRHGGAGRGQERARSGPLRRRGCGGGCGRHPKPWSFRELAPAPAEKEEPSLSSVTARQSNVRFARQRHRRVEPCWTGLRFPLQRSRMVVSALVSGPLRRRRRRRGTRDTSFSSPLSCLRRRGGGIVGEFCRPRLSRPDPAGE